MHYAIFTCMQLRYDVDFLDFPQADLKGLLTSNISSFSTVCCSDYFETSFAVTQNYRINLLS